LRLRGDGHTVATMIPRGRRAFESRSAVGMSGDALALVTDGRVLVQRIRAGDEAAFEALFRSTYDALYASVYRIVQSAAVAEELVQDLFVAVWADRARWDPGDTIDRVRAYLFIAARRRALNAVRREAVERRWVEQAELAPSERAVESAEVIVERAERVRAVREAVARLPERGRAVLLLQWRRGLTYPEIAECLGISVKTVEVHVSRALKALRRSLAGVRGT
jgi:RNA polymerase sigma-70 factor (ECF subfamily)